MKRNVGGAVNALAAADMALAGISSRIPVDQVIDAMREVGEKMDVSLRETGVGGVAGSPCRARSCGENDKSIEGVKKKIALGAIFFLDRDLIMIYTLKIK